MGAMTMLEVLLSLVLVLPLAADDEKKSPPDPELVKSTIARLEKAYKSNDPAETKKALEAATEVVHPEVISRVARGLKEKDIEIKTAVLEALRWMDHPDALEELHATYERDESLREHEALSAVLLKAIGQHGDPSSIEILAGDLVESPNHQAIRARLLGLGNIRKRESVEALLNLMQRDGRGTQPAQMEDYRLALLVLTGTDQGPSRDRWVRWWNENKKTLEISAELPELPRPKLLEWRRFWGLQVDYGPGERREDRGDDPERERRKRDGGG
jgi:hypothetical protein